MTVIHGTRQGSPVAPAIRSAAADVKARRKQLEDGTPVQSFESLLKDLAMLAKNQVRSKTVGAVTFDMLTMPTPVQQRAFDLLGRLTSAGADVGQYPGPPCTADSG